jgi:hypothetical protein
MVAITEESSTSSNIQNEMELWRDNAFHIMDIVCGKKLL